MKTQTSKTRIWLSTLLLLPIIAILFYSFAERDYVEKTPPVTSEIQQNFKTLVVSINNKNEFFVNGELRSYAFLENLLKEFPKSEYKVYFNSDKGTSFETVKKTLQLFAKYNVFTESYNESKTVQQKATKEQLAEYNAWAKTMNKAIENSGKGNYMGTNYSFFNEKEYDTYEYIYIKLMSPEQRDNAEPFPKLFPPPPPPPPAPEAPKASKAGINRENVTPPSPPLTTKKPENSKGDQQSTEKQQAKKIQPIEIFIDKNDNVQLNGKRIKVEDINNEVTKLNQHLSVEDHRKYVIASIAIEKNKSSDLAKTIQTNLKEVNIWSSGISYYENVTKSNLPKRSFNLYSGLTLEEAKVEEKKIFSDSINIEKKIDSINNSGGPWKINVANASYEFIDDDGNSTGKINLDPAEIATPPKSAYEYVKTLKNKEIQYIYNKRKVSYKEILEILEKNTNINMSTNIKNAKGTVKFWTKD